MGFSPAIVGGDQVLSELAGVARTLPNPHLLINLFIRREAALSSRSEGTQASFSNLLFFEASEMTEQRMPDMREVSNYVRALEYGQERLKTLPISLRLNTSTICQAAPSSKLHSLTIPSLPPVSSNRPSGENSTWLTSKTIVLLARKCSP